MLLPGGGGRALPGRARGGEKRLPGGEALARYAAAPAASAGPALGPAAPRGGGGTARGRGPGPPSSRGLPAAGAVCPGRGLVPGGRCLCPPRHPVEPRVPLTLRGPCPPRSSRVERFGSRSSTKVPFPSPPAPNRWWCRRDCRRSPAWVLSGFQYS